MDSIVIVVLMPDAGQPSHVGTAATSHARPGPIRHQAHESRVRQHARVEPVAGVRAHVGQQHGPVGRERADIDDRRRDRQGGHETGQVDVARLQEGTASPITTPMTPSDEASAETNPDR
jgi:hypothetical protein